MTSKPQPLRSDAVLLDALRAGDRGALAEVFERYADRLYRLALGVVREPADAEDVVQEAFLKLLRGVARLRGEARLGTWLYRVTYNASVDRVRRARRLAGAGEEDAASETLTPRALGAWSRTPEEILADAEARATLDDAIEGLAEGLRSVFLLRDVEGLSTADTAEVLGIKPGAVKVRLHRARLQLREQLAHYFGERAS